MPPDRSTDLHRACNDAEYARARQLPDHEKARLWDKLATAIQKPGLRDLTVRQVSAMLRAVNLLLCYRDQLPPALTREPDAYKPALDAMHLESADGWADADGVLNLLPIHMILSLMGALDKDGERDA
jgi:hypothetical protein